MSASGVLGKLKVILAVDATQMQKGLDQSKSGLKKFGQQMNRISDEVNRVFVRSMVAGTAALTAFGAASAKVGSDFEAAMAFVGATANSTGVEMKALEKEARAIGSSTLFSARQAAEGMTEFARAGMTTNEIISASRPAMLLAGATMTDMATATQGMSATLKQFGLDTTEASRVSDVLALATRRSLFNLTGLLTAMKYGGPQARAYGMSLEEAVAGMMEFRNIGLEAHQAGVYFRMMLAKTGKVTPEAEKELKKYGLTTESISLKTNNFAGVLKNLADADIPKAAGAMERIFGVRAGPVVQVLVENMKQGKDEFNEFTAALISSGGTTEEMYNRILDTVQAQFTIMKSAFEELMIVIFQTYGQALQEFFGQLAETLAFTAEYLSRSKQLGSGVSDMLQSMTEWLGRNKAFFAQFIEDTVTLIGTLISVMIVVARHARIIIALLAGAFVASKVYTYTLAIVALGTAFKGMATAILAARAAGIAAMATAAVASGGTYAIVLAIGSAITAIATALYMIPGASNTAISSLDKFLAIDEKRKANELKGYKESEKGSKTYIAALRQELIAQGDLDSTTESHMRNLENMTGTQMQNSVATGTWIDVMREGEKVTLSQALVFDLYSKGTEEGIKLHGELQKTIKDETNEIAKLASETDFMMRKAKNYNELISRSMGAWTSNADLRSKFHRRFKVSLDEVEAKEKANEAKLVERRKKLEGLARTYHEQELRMQRQSADATVQAANTEIESNKRVSKEHEKLIAKRIKAELKLAQFQKKLAREKRLLDSHGLLERRFQLEDELEAHQKLVDEVTKLYKEGHAKREEIERQAIRTRGEIITKSIAEFYSEMRQMREKLVAEDHENAAVTEKEKRKVANQAELDDLKLQRDKAVKMYEEGALERMDIDYAYAEARAKLRDTHAKRERAIEAQAREEFRNTLQSESEDLAKALMGPRLALQLDYAKRVAEMRKVHASKEQLEIAATIHRLKLRQLAKEEFAVLKSIKDRGRKATKLELLSERAGFGIFKKFFKSRAKMKEREHKLEQKRLEYKNLKDTLTRDEQKMAEQEMANEAFAIWKEKIGKIIKVIGDIGKAVAATVKGMTAIAKKGAETFKFFTGFEFDLRGIVSEFAAASSEMASKGATMDVKAEAAKKVSELVSNATGFMKMAVAAVPALLQELTAQLPGLFNEFVEMVPQIIQGFADNIGNLVKVIVDNIPAMITAVLSSLPNLATVLADAITTIIAALPAILDAIIAELPAILDALLAGLVQIILQLADTLPVLIEQIVGIIPIVLEAVIGALPELLPALVRLIMRVVISLLQAIPDLLDHIFEAIPMLITALMEALPEILVELISMLPKLIAAVLALIPRIVIGIVKMIPNIIASFFTAFFGELLPVIPKIVMMIVKSALMAIIEGMEKIGQAIGDLFRSKEGKKKAKARRDERSRDTEEQLRNEFAGEVGLESFYSGINYVPSNMRVNVHKGEAIIPADRNAARSRGGTQQPLAGAGGSGSMGQSAPIDIAIMAEGRLLDAVQVTAMKRGNAPGISKQLTRASGVTVGLDRGRFNYWTKSS